MEAQELGRRRLVQRRSAREAVEEALADMAGPASMSRNQAELAQKAI